MNGLPKELIDHIWYFRSYVEKFFDELERTGDYKMKDLLNLDKDNLIVMKSKNNTPLALILKLLLYYTIKNNDVGGLIRVIRIGKDRQIDLIKLLIVFSAISTCDKTALAVEIAYNNGYIDIIKFLCETFGDNKTFAPNLRKTVDFLVKKGNLEILKLSKETYFKNEKLCYDKATIYAAENGDLEMLKWLKENAIHFLSKRFIYPSIESIEIAKQKGYSDVVKWGEENCL